MIAAAGRAGEPDQHTAPWAQKAHAMTYEDWIKNWSDEVAANAPPFATEPTLQPGLGVPAAALEQVAANPTEIEMPAVDVAAERARAEQAEIEMPVVDVAAERAKAEPQVQIGFPRPWGEDTAEDATATIDQQIAASMIPDAISGGALAPRPAMQPGLGIPQATLDRAFAQPLHERTVDEQIAASFNPDLPLPEPRSRFEDVADARGQMTDLEAAADDTLHTQIAQQQANRQRLEAERRATEEADAALKARLEARERARRERDEINAEAKKLSEQTIGAGDWYAEGGVGRHVGALIVAALGGLVQHLNGGRNIGLEAIDTHINRFIAAKQADRAHQRGVLGDRSRSLEAQLAQADADYREDETLRRATYERALRQVELEHANYDPEGTLARQLDGVRRQMRAKMEADELAAQQARAKRLEELMKVQREEERLKIDRDKAAEDARKNRADERLRGYAIGSENQRAAARLAFDEKKAASETQLLSPDYYAATYPGNPKPPHEMTRKQYAEWIDLSTKGPAAAADARKAAAEATTKEAAARLESSGPSGSPYAVADQEGSALLQKDGKSVFEIKDDTQRRRAMDILESAQNVRRIADLVKLMRADSGGASSTVGSPEYQELQSLASQIDFETFVGYGLGAPSEGDKALAEGVRGGKDISSFLHDPSSGFEAYAKGIEEKATVALRKLGYTGEPVKLKRIERAQATERNTLQNEQVWQSDLLKAEDPKIRTRAAQRAVDSADALARGKEVTPGWLKIMASEAKERRDAGLFTEEQYERVMKSVRREWRRKLEDYDIETQVYLGGAPRVGTFVVGQKPAFTEADRNAQTDAQIFAPLGRR